ncbi:MAG: hypothetical protein IVW55_17885, partial [Chloroflexi bacterium]|nr:hypothetical protein [Chloroflexota bacterium]
MILRIFGVPLAIIVLALLSPAWSATQAQAHYVPPVARVTYYSPGLMERVARYRGLYDPQGRYTTDPRCWRIGSHLRMALYNSVRQTWGATQSFLVVDCAQPRDLSRQLSVNLHEVSYEAAVRAGFAGEGYTWGVI